MSNKERIKMLLLVKVTGVMYSFFCKRGHAEFIWINNNIQSCGENKIFMNKLFCCLLSNLFGYLRFCFCSSRCVYLRVYLLGGFFGGF